MSLPWCARWAAGGRGAQRPSGRRSRTTARRRRTARSTSPWKRRIRVPRQPARSWVCTSNLHCVHGGPIPPGESLPPLNVSVPVPDSADPTTLAAGVSVADDFDQVASNNRVELVTGVERQLEVRRAALFDGEAQRSRLPARGLDGGAGEVLRRHRPTARGACGGPPDGTQPQRQRRRPHQPGLDAGVRGHPHRLDGRPRSGRQRPHVHRQGIPGGADRTGRHWS